MPRQNAAVSLQAWLKQPVMRGIPVIPGLLGNDVPGTSQRSPPRRLRRASFRQFCAVSLTPRPRLARAKGSTRERKRRKSGMFGKPAVNVKSFLYCMILYSTLLYSTLLCYTILCYAIGYLWTTERFIKIHGFGGWHL